MPHSWKEVTCMVRGNCTHTAILYYILLFYYIIIVLYIYIFYIPSVEYDTNLGYVKIPFGRRYFCYLPQEKSSFGLETKF